MNNGNESHLPVSEVSATVEKYTGHAFVRQLAAGTLPERCFRHYLIQDYLFLIHFARAGAGGLQGR